MNNDWLTIEREGRRVILKKCSQEAEGKVIIPDGVTEIAAEAFYQCENVNDVHIPEGVETIGRFAFAYTGLTSLHLPASIRNIESKVHTSLYKATPFMWNLEMSTITVDKNNPVYDSRDNCNAIIETASNRLIVGCKNTFIPDSVSIIGNGAFYGMSGTLKIPKGVKEIEPYAFLYCSLSYVFISNSDAKIKTSSFSHSTMVQRGCNTLRYPKLYEAGYQGLFNIEFRPNLIRKYYSTLFNTQLRSYFCNNEDKGTCLFISRLDDDYHHRFANEMPGNNINENLLFASSLLYMIIAQQSIELIAPEAEEDFHKGIGWPMLKRGLYDDKCHNPLEILKLAGLSPMKSEVPLFLAFVVEAFLFFREEINAFLNGRKGVMKDLVAGKHFFENVDGHKRARIRRYLDQQEKIVKDQLKNLQL